MSYLSGPEYAEKIDPLIQQKITLAEKAIELGDEEKAQTHIYNTVLLKALLNETLSFEDYLGFMNNQTKKKYTTPAD